MGQVSLHPNLVNVIPGRATLTVDLRHTDDNQLLRAEQELAAYLPVLAAEQGVQIHSRRLARFAPVQFNPRLVRLAEASAAARGLRQRRMTSGAGHDAQMLAQGSARRPWSLCPASAASATTPRENTDAHDLVNGANVLAGLGANPGCRGLILPRSCGGTAA